MHSKDGSGHLAHAGQGGHFEALSGSLLLLLLDEELYAGQAGHTGGTTWDFKIYKSSWPDGIWLAGIPGGREL